MGQDFAFVDSLIRADKKIGTISISTMSGRLFDAQFPKYYPPRIEAPEIESLTVGLMDMGKVWSGKLANTLGPPAVLNDINDDYSNIGAVTIGCVGPTADLWLVGTPILDITADMLGEIHVPNLGTTQIVRIGGAFGWDPTDPQPVPCDTSVLSTYWWNTVPTIEGSPRGYWAEVEDNCLSDGLPQFARILVQDEAALDGHVILHASNTVLRHFAEKWSGDVVIGTGDPAVPPVTTTKVLSTNGARATGADYVGPEYLTNGQSIGAGAVGLVPFALHRSDTFPWSGCVTLPCGLCITGPCGPNGMPVVSRTQFEGDGIVLPLYGPVRGNAPTGQGIVHLFQANGQGVPEWSVDYGPSVTQLIDGHTLVLKGNSSIPNGRYVVYHDFEDDNLLCDQLRTSTDVPAKGFVYHFVLFSRYGCEPNANNPCGGDSSCSDFNGDGDAGTDQDIEAFFACIGGNCCATCGSPDFNCDGDTATDQDIEAYFRALGGDTSDCENCNPNPGP